MEAFGSKPEFRFGPVLIALIPLCLFMALQMTEPSRATVAIGFCVLGFSCILNLFLGFRNWRKAKPAGLILLSFGVIYFYVVEVLDVTIFRKEIFEEFSLATASISDWVDAGMLIGLFYFCAVLGLSIRPGKRLVRAAARSSIPESPGVLFLIALVGIAVSAVPILVYGGQGFIATLKNSMLSARSGFYESGLERGNLGDARAPVLALGMLAGVSFFLLAGILFSRVARPLLKFASLVLLFGLLVTGSASGTRSATASMLLPLFVMMALRLYESKRWRKAAFVAMVGAVFCAYLVFQVQYYYRSIGWGGFHWNKEIVLNPQGYQYTSEVVTIHTIYPRVKPFVSGQTLIERLLKPIPERLFWIVINPVPRAWWPGKPLPPGWADYTLIRTGSLDLDRATTIASSIVGSSYRDFGLPGVVEIGLFYGFLLGLFQAGFREIKGWEPMRLVPLLVFGYWLLYGFRGLGATPVLYTLLMLIALGWGMKALRIERTSFAISRKPVSPVRASRVLEE